MENIKNNIVLIILNFIEIVLLVLILNSKLCVDNYKYQEDKSIVKEEKVAVLEENNISDTLTIDIKGAVKNPGVYTLEKGSIVNDAIQAAGGINKNAYLDFLNLSKKLKNEMVIHIYTNKEIRNFRTKEVVDVEKNIEKEVCVCEKEVINVCEGSSIIESSNENIASDVVEKDDVISTKEEIVDNNEIEASSENIKLSINTATKEELMSLNGIGESKAKAIIEYRNSNGLFNSIEDIKNVTGIGEGLFAKIKDYITV